MSINKTYLGYNAERLETAPAFVPYSKVIAWYDNENAFVAGDDSGRVLEVDLHFATQEIVNGMLERIRGYAYQPWTGTRAILDPAAELGDGVTINGVYSVLASTETTFDGLMLSDAAAPADEEVDHEYQYVSPTRKALRRKVTLGASYYGTSIDRKRGIHIAKTNADGTTASRATLNSDVVEFRNDDGQLALYFDINDGKFKFRGDVHITGGDLNINDNFVVDTEGNVSLNGDINLSGGKIIWGGNNPAKDKLDKDDLPDYLHKTYIDETEIYSPSIYGGTLYATDGSDLYARMSESAFELMRDGDDAARAQLRAYSNLVELVLGVGSDDGGENGRLYIQKAVGSLNGGEEQNLAYMTYKDINGVNSIIGFSDNDGMFLAAEKISFSGKVDFSQATVTGLDIGSAGDIEYIEADNPYIDGKYWVQIWAGETVQLKAGDDIEMNAADGALAFRMSTTHERFHFYINGTTWILDEEGLHLP